MFVFPAKAEGHAEPRLDLPLILREESVILGGEIQTRQTGALIEVSVVLGCLAGGGVLREVQIREVVAERGSAGVFEKAALAVEVGEEVVGVNEILAEFEVVVAVNPLDGVGQLPA